MAQINGRWQQMCEDYRCFNTHIFLVLVEYDRRSWLSVLLLDTVYCAVNRKSTELEKSCLGHVLWMLAARLLLWSEQNRHPVFREFWPYSLMSQSRVFFHSDQSCSTVQSFCLTIFWFLYHNSVVLDSDENYGMLVQPCIQWNWKLTLEHRSVA